MILRSTLASTDPMSFLLCDEDYMDDCKDNIEYQIASKACKEYGIWCPTVSLN